MMKLLHLGDEMLEIQQICLPQLKIIMPIIFRAHRWAQKGLLPLDQGGDVDGFFAEAPQGLDDAITLIVAVTGRDRAEIEAIPANAIQAASAINIIGIESGALVPVKSAEEQLSGEAHGQSQTGPHTGSKSKD